MRARPNCVSLMGLDPSGTGQREFWIEKDLLQLFYKRDWMDKYKSVYLVKEIMESPSVIFEGLERVGQDEALCYAGLASCRYTKAGNQLPRPPGTTFAVYIRSDDVIFRWDWEPADKNLRYPLDYDSRFRRQLWPAI